MAETLHVVVLPSPGMGHLLPIIEFARRLVRLHNFHVTCIIPTIGPPPPPMKAALQALPHTINSIFLPPVSCDDLQENTETPVITALSVSRSLSSLRDVLKSLIRTTHFVAFFVDPLAIDALDVAMEFNLSPYLFIPSNALSLSLFFYLPKLDEMVTCEFRDHPQPIKIPGFIPVHGSDLLEALQNRTSDAYKLFLNFTKRLGSFKAIVLNTFMDMELGALKVLREEPIKPPIYPIGPFLRTASSESNNGSGSESESESDTLKWLDNQPCGSVVFVSFGSGGTLSHAQLKELAFGLEMSEQRFLWVVKSPNDENSDATYFSLQCLKNPFDFLPNGFLERTKERGLVVSSWAPQAEVLKHQSIGGFLTHCGWNSILESVVNGVPLIAWPLYAEQKMNAAMVTEDVKVALRPKANQSGLVVREEIARVVKELLEGDEGNKIRKRVKELKNAAAMALMENGSSTKALSELVLELKKLWECHVHQIIYRL